MKNEKNILHTQVILFELTFQTRCSRDTYGNTINRQEIQKNFASLVTFKHAASTEYKHAHLEWSLWSDRCLDKKKTVLALFMQTTVKTIWCITSYFLLKGSKSHQPGHKRDTFRQTFCHATETNLECYNATYIEVPATANRHHNKCLTNIQQTSYVVTKKNTTFLIITQPEEQVLLW